MSSLFNLAAALDQIKDAEAQGDYGKRNWLIYAAMGLAALSGFGVGIRLDQGEADPEWPVVFIELPTGQVSWHVPAHTNEWDGHSTEEKYRRCDAYISTGRSAL